MPLESKVDGSLALYCPSGLTLKSFSQLLPLSSSFLSSVLVDSFPLFHTFLPTVQLLTGHFNGVGLTHVGGMSSASAAVATAAGGARDFQQV